MYWSNHMSAGGWILSVLWTVIIIALVVAGVVWLVSTASNRESRPLASQARGASAREILDRRLANGELTVEQYQQLRETIRDPAPASPDTVSQRPAGAPG
jgi:putative membrane protein